jgi:site-specific DNA-methyltransferase (adenine-specific)
MENQEEQKIHLYSEGKSYKLYQGNMLDMLDIIEPNSIDAVVTDPPYELGFMNKGWDNSGIAFQRETWEKCLKALKPGGYLLAFGGSRTSHRIACAIEDAGFEVRDTIMWLYGSGFPKSMNIGLAIDKKNGVESEVVGIKHHCQKDFKESNLYAQDPANRNNTKCFGYGDEIVRQAQNEWSGWGTALKPAYEPITVARKPFEGACVDNVLTYGTGGINIDECRVPANPGEYDIRHYTHEDCFQNLTPKQSHYQVKPQPEGRFPANVILTYDDTDKEEVCSGMPDTKSNGGATTMPDFKDAGQKNSYNKIGFNDGDTAERKQSDYVCPMDEGSAARYFYCAKASKRDRDEGCENLEDKTLAMSNQAKAELKRGNTDFTGDPTSPLNAFNTVQVAKNNHPTVKPVNLMQYLIRLVTPKGGTILDPFNGSGSTGKAAMFENKDRNANYKYIGIELTPEYLPISKARIEYAINYVDVVEEKPVSVEKKKLLNNQISLFNIS